MTGYIDWAVFETKQVISIAQSTEHALRNNYL